MNSYSDLPSRQNATSLDATATAAAAKHERTCLAEASACARDLEPTFAFRRLVLWN